MDLLTLCVVAFAVAFLVSLVDYFVAFGIARAGIALGLSLIATVPLDLTWWSAVTLALAASFLAMFLLQVIERMNFRTVGRAR